MATLQVPRRIWGRTGLSIPVIPFGTQGFGNHFGDVGDDAAIALVHHAIDLGVNHFDCARCYGDSLRKLGLALQGVPRERVIVSARLCLHRVLTPLQLEHAGTADDVVRDVEDQLKLLHIDFLDALLLHDPSDMAPVLAKGGALDGALRLKDRGLVRHVGFGMRPHDFHRQALETGAVDVMLTFSDFNLLRRSAAERGGILEQAAKHGVGVLNGFSIMRGILTGAPVAEAAERGRWTNAEDIARATAMRQWAIDREVSLLDIALQFCLAEIRIHGNPLGNQNIAELEQNVAAVSKPLPDGILKEFLGAAL
ncbi:MAG: aldo/keto reductase [Chloroflexi bacterium]|jgi:aryl-alcohol dehydrogenase-like predicted oxidoreductase|nr:aldo/keto reductase [Chloroflexota bacterium]